MNVLIVSQCSKNALTETRRVLDQFAERRGDRSWQTPITWDGLLTLRKLLKKTARKNTAVACHWIRGKDHSELMWVVGDTSRFNAEGAVPTNTTSLDILRKEDENDWHTLDTLALLAAIAGLFHDFGKANKLFQGKLNPKKKKTLQSEPLRHEWVSLRLFMAFVGELKDQEWLEKLNLASAEMENELLEKLEKDTSQRPKAPWAKWTNQPLALTVAWLIVSHHRLPVFPKGKSENPEDSRPVNEPPSARVDQWLQRSFNAGWNSPQLYSDWKPEDWQGVWEFPQGTPLRSKTWCNKAHSLAKRALKASSLKKHPGLNDLYTSHLARMVLMLADHIYSASDPTSIWQDKAYKAYANTDRETSQLKQKLDEHNLGVAHQAYLLARRLPDLSRQLPAITRVKALKKRVTISRFRWQDKAYDLARSLGPRSEKQGFFGVNLASTGCGKTFANARIMYGLANEQRGCRFNVALGLRTLTLQTGDALKEKLQLDKEDLATLVGSQAVKVLYDQAKENSKKTEDSSSVWEKMGSESAEELMESDLHVHYDGILDENLSNWLRASPKLQQLVSAPVLISTLDYLMPATEGARGGRQIAPMLRLMTSDLVLDEPDDFGLEDLPALCRLVHWAGLLGSRVLLSSATLPPALVEALFSAYKAGRHGYLQARGEPSEQANALPCAWFDEFNSVSHTLQNEQDFAAAHTEFVKNRIKELAKKQQKEAPLRWGQLLDVSSETPSSEEVAQGLADSFHQELLVLHDHHKQPSGGQVAGKEISFGLIRMANINPLVAVAQKLLAKPLPENYRLHFCVYHGQYPLLMRSRIERVLDEILNRNKPDKVWENSVITDALNQGDETQHIFIVLGSAVTEVGRDHDYDWAIAEPSSMRSLIQLAGRIQRHRQMAPQHPNLLIPRKNFKALQNKKPAYLKPGFESEDFQLLFHDLKEVLKESQYQHINATPRLLRRKNHDPANNLADLEHEHLAAKLEFAALWWQSNPTWSYELQRRTPFRQSSPDELLLLYQEDELDELKFHSWQPGEKPNSQDQRFHSVDLHLADRIQPWVNTNPQELIDEQAERQDEEVATICKKFMQIRLRAEQQWHYHALLGIHQELK
ncbi:type I-F CRISPR-associated helicase Cas3f [Marinospirillum perlucidum]|uniref:type I-F CRISPR-associated helicase Cas3f n=1 Tax=Marinospirillum perlucidum TaxID=1982602 RepID=UPI000DF4AF80|nr:type I-F CRISPR-associated helicase Cas3f [Marinospirillum perlucidum]